MKKSTTAVETDYQPPFDFYRPHARVTYTGELVNHRTGEVYTPIRRVKQSFVDECDINLIMKQFGKTGQIRHINGRAQQGQYLNLPDDLDYQTSLNIIKKGEEAFASLPAKTRERFGNDPALFLEFMHDEKNLEEAVSMGLVSKSPIENPPPELAPKPPQAPSTPPAPPEPPKGS